MTSSESKVSSDYHAWEEEKKEEGEERGGAPIGNFVLDEYALENHLEMNSTSTTFVNSIFELDIEF